MVRGAAARLGQAAGPLHRLNLGATAAGTGLNAHPLYAARVARLLSRVTGLRLRPAADLIEAAMSTADFAAFSSALRLLALDLGLPAVQPGSSIMPGKVNPSMCEMLNMVCFEVIGRDAAVAAASGAGQLELNVMMPVMIDDILEAMAILTAASGLFASRCLA